MKKIYLLFAFLLLNISVFAVAWRTNSGGPVTTLSNWVDVTTGLLNPVSFSLPGDTWNIQNSMTLGIGVNWSVAGSVSFSGSGNQLNVNNGDTITIGGNLTLNNTGSANRFVAIASGSHYVLYLGGNLDLEGSSYISSTTLGGGGSTVIFDGGTSFASPQTITNNSTGNTNGALNIMVAAGSFVSLTENTSLLAMGWGSSSSNTFTVNGTLNCQGFTLGSGSPGTFIVASGGTLAIGTSPGISAAPTATGCILVSTTRTFSATANYMYIGSSAQTTGTGLPASLSSPATLTINNASGVTLTGSTSLDTGTTLAFTSGKLSIGSGNTLAISGNLTGMSSSTNFFGGSSTSNLAFGGHLALGSIYFDETTSGTTNNIDTFTINSTGSVTLGNALNVSNGLNLYNGTLTNGSNLTLGNASQVNRDYGTLSSVPTYGSSGSAVINVTYINGGPDSLTITTGNELPTTGTNLGNVTVNKASATIKLNSAITVNGNVTITSGTLDNSSGSYTLTFSGNWTNNSGNSAYVPGTSSANLSSSSASTIGGSFATKFYNLSLTDAAGTTIGDTVIVNNTLTLANGLVTLGSSNLILGASSPAIAGSFSSSTMIVATGTGQLRKHFTSNGSYLFPVGDGTPNYTPITLSVSGSSYLSGAYAGVNVHNIKHPNNVNTTNYLNRYWSISTFNITSPVYDVTSASYITSDVVGIESAISAGKYAGSLPWVKYGSVNTSTHTFSASSISDVLSAVTGITTASPTLTYSVAGAGNCNGHDTITAVGTGDAPLTYTWTPSIGLSATTGATVSTILTGSATYTVTVTDGMGFTTSNVVSLTLPSIPTLSSGLSVAPTAICVGSTLILGVTGSSGSGSLVSYNWSGPGGYSSTTTTLTQSYTIPSVSATGIYSLSVTYTGAGCTSSIVTSSPVSVNIPVAPITGAVTACIGSSVTLSDVSPIGSGSGWASSVTTVATVVAGTGVVTAVGSGATIISYTINNPGCGTTTATTTFTVPAVIVDVPTQTNVTCFGLSNGIGSVLPVSGGTSPYVYLWSPSGGTVATATGLAAGSYTCTITDAIGCTKAQTFNITQPTVLAATTTQTNNLCHGGTSGIATIATTTGGTSPYSYLWNPGGATTTSITGLAAGIYTCVVTDFNLCTTTKTVTITAPTAITASIAMTAASCNGTSDGSATVSAVSGGTSPYSYSWAPSGGSTATASGIAANTYTCTITDASSCSITKTVTVTQPAALAATATTVNVACFGGSTGSASVAPVTGGTPPYTYSWIGGTVSSTTATASGLSAALYACTITDAHVCSLAVLFNITQPSAALSATTIVSNVLCHGTATGAATVNPAGGTPGYTYLWSPSGGSGAVATGLIAGTYSCTVTDANLCNIVKVVTITQPLTLAASISGTGELCNGGTTGSATVNVTAGTGTPGYTYSWSPSGATGSIAPGLSAGVNTCTITDANGCTLNKVITITQPPAITSGTAQSNVSCFGGTNGSASVTGASGGTGTLTYTWAGSGSVSSTTTTAIGLVAGTYTCTITDANSCSITKVFIITQPAILAATSTQTNVLCHGGATGAVTVNVTGGTTPYSYSWAPSGGSAAIATALVVGTYTCTITDLHACSTTQIVTITQPATLTTTSTSSNVSCHGGNDGTASVTPAGGTTPYSYLWSPSGGTGSSVLDFAAGTYTCTITDAHLCTITQSFTITEPTAITASSIITNVSCFGGSNGSVILSAAGGTGSYSYTWAPSGGTSATATGLTAGTYTCTVTDASLCAANIIVTVLQPTLLTATTSQVNVLCSGGATGSATVNPSGGTPGYTYMWLPSGGSAAIATGLAAGIYTCTIIDAHSCTLAKIFTITATPAITATSTATPVSCFGGSNGTASEAGVTGGTGSYTYSWAPSGGSAATATGLTAGTYTCTITDGSGCTSSFVATVTQPLALTAATSSTDLSCFGSDDGSATVTVSGGTTPYTYSWSGSSSTAATAGGLAAGSYFCTITDAHGCSLIKLFTITQPATITASVVSQTNVSCFGGFDGIVTISAAGGSGGYSYSWSPSGGFAATATGLTAGVYVCDITDASLCTGTFTVTITQPAAVSATGTVTNVSCNGGSNGSVILATSGGTSPYTYSWSPSGGTAATATGLAAGSYTCTITDVHTCTGTYTVTITQPAVLTASTTSTNVSCHSGSNGTATVTASGGTGPYTYSWSPSGGSTATATGLVAGTYTCTITDLHLCTFAITVTITEPSSLSAAIFHTDISCNGASDGSATVNPTGGVSPYTYSWVPSGGTGSIASGLSAGSYICTVTDANSCTQATAVTILQPAAISAVSTQTNVSCHGGSNGTATVTPSGGTSPYSYSWSPSGGTGATAIGLSAGTYTCTITDAHLCTFNKTVTITEPAPITGTTSGVTNVTCFGGSDGSVTAIPAGGTSPYTYLWSPSAQTSATATGLSAGIYSCTITDAGSCTQIVTVNITQPAAITASIAQVNVSCNGGSNGSTTLTAAGGTGPYTYSWLPSGGTAATATGLSAGTYTCTITDLHLCTGAIIVTITQPAVLTATTSQTNVSCNGGNNGTATATPGGGTAPYSYSWVPSGGSAATGTGFTAGSYICNITDFNGCTTAVAVTITQPPVLTASNTHTDVSCNGGNNGTGTITASGGTTPYTYSWFPSGGTGATGTGLTAGTYTCTVTDFNLCTITSVVTIVQPAAITASTTHTNVFCNGGSDGTATVTAGGGVGSLTYSWSPSGGTAATATGLSAGTYTCTITDTHSCTDMATVTITEPAPLTVSTTQTNVSCNGGSNGTGTVTPIGGASPYTYLWSPSGGTGATGTGFSAGTYSCTITDNNGCTSSHSVTITQPSALTASISGQTNVSCSGLSNGNATVAVTGGTGAHTYSWSPSGGTGATGTGFAAGTYTCTVTDSNLCTTTTTVTITQPAVLSSSNAPTNVTCNGGNNGSDVVTASGGTAPYTYSWSPSGGTLATATGLSAGTYTCAITDANSCSVNAIITIAQPAAVTSSSTTSTAVSVSGASDGTASVTAAGGTSPYTYSWSPSGGTAATATGLPAGTYTCTITDANSCTGVATVTVTSPAPLTATATHTNVSCFGGSNGTGTVTPSGGTSPYTYSWAPTGGSGVTGTGFSIGTYTCTVTDAHAGTVTVSVTITQPTVLASSITGHTNVLCHGGNNGNAIVSASGGTTPYIYSWSPMGGTGATGTGLTAGTYTCTVTDSNLCTSTSTVTITEPAGLSVTTGTVPVTCHGGNNGTATVSASGGSGSYTYSWSPSGGTGATGTGLSAGSYTCTITDASSCSTPAVVTITEPTAVTATTSETPTSVFGSSDGTASVVASGGSGSGYTYSWAPTGGTGATATGLSAGTYSCTITDGSSCTGVVTVVVTSPAPLSATSTSTSVSCFGGSDGTATVTPSGGTSPYTYSWAPTGGTGATGTGFAAGTYTCTITDAHAGTFAIAVTVTQPAVLTASVTAQTNVSCHGGNNGTATVTPVGGTGPYTYSWSPVGGTGATGTGFSVGSYTCTVTDAHSCSATTSASVTEPSALSATTSHTNELCHGGNTATATVVPSGGTAPYTYVWTPSGGSGATGTGLTAGSFACSIFDANGCLLTKAFAITQPSAITFSGVGQTNVTCNGGSNGTAHATASGGTGPKTYSWSPTGGTSTTATGLSAGVYTLTATDSLGCTAAHIFTVTEPPVFTAVDSQTNVTCFGFANGTATVIASGGTPPYLYSWSAPAVSTTATASSLDTGTYACTIEDTNGCFIVEIFIITQPAILTSTVSQTNVSCFAGSNGTATVTPSGGTTPYSYSWSPSGETAATATGLSAISYTCTITDANLCTLPETFSLTQPTALAATNSHTNITCNGGSDGTATITTTSGGVSPYTYAWSPTGGTATTAVGLPAGTYTCAITDSHSCVLPVVITLTQPLPVTATAVQTNVTCNGLSNGSVTLTASGGTGSIYTYSWAPSGGTAATATGLAAGTYTCTITDSVLCTGTKIITITQPGVLTAVDSQVNVSCHGLTNGIAIVTVSGGTTPYSYSWAPSGGAAATATGLAAGTYTCTITDFNSCTTTGAFTITQPAVLASTISHTDVNCNGGSDGTATVVPSGGTTPYSYIWSPSAETVSSATGLSAGSYTCTITDANLCVLTKTVTLTQPAAITAVDSQSNITCNSGANGFARVTVSGGTTPYTYVWAPSGGSALSASGLSAGSYTCTITDAHSCTLPQTFNLTQPAAITGTSTVTPVSVFGASDGHASITASGGTGAYTYSWAPSGGTAATATGLSAGTYTCTVTDASLCSGSIIVTVTSPAAMTSTTAITNVSCHGGSNGVAIITPSGGTMPYTYSWSPSAQTSATATGLSAGNYTCTVTDAHFGVYDTVITITQPLALSVAASHTNVSCNGGNNGTDTLTVSGGTTPYAYSWSPLGGTGAIGTGLSAGSYTCTVTDANLCVITSTVTITQPSAITATTSHTNETCNGGSNGTASVSVNPATGTSPYTYSWSPSGGTAATATGLLAGSYTCHIVDAHLCSIDSIITITQPAAITATFTMTPVTCNGLSNGRVSITASGGTGAYTYSWSPSGGSAATITGRSAGTYTCTITDASLCTGIAIVAITQPAVLSAIDSQHNESCSGTSDAVAFVNPTGGTSPYTYSWSGSAGSAATATGLAIGTYSCTITDANSCTSVQTFTITAPAILSGITSHTNVSCHGGSNGTATVTPGGGTSPYTYAWSPSGETAATATGLSAGTHTVTITDAHLCTLTKLVIITQPTAITASNTISDVTCFGGSDGHVVVGASGGTGMLTYSWAPTGGSTATASGLSAITYTCTITDSNSCTLPQLVVITSPTAITAVDSQINVSCHGGSNARAWVTVSGGTGSYTYSWSPSGGTAATATGLVAGTYTCTITDASSCTGTQLFTITQPAAITAIDSQVNPTCHGAPDGIAWVTVSGGATPYSYSWSPSGGAAAAATGLSAGSYTCTITDSNLCTLPEVFTLIGPSTLTASSFISTVVACYGDSDAVVTVSATGGTTPYTYSWAPAGGTAATATGLPAGTYSCTITDAHSCSFDMITTVTQPVPIVSVDSQTNVSCYTGSNGYARVYTAGGTTPYTYSWSPTGGTASTASGLSAGTYTVTITDTHGCFETEIFTILQPSSALTATISQTNVTCFGDSNGTATVTASGGTPSYSYAWSPSGGMAMVGTGLAAGTYTCTLTDANSCTLHETFTIVQPFALTSSVTDVDVVCYGDSTGTASVTVGGGTLPYSYFWSPSGGTGATASGLAAGNYTCTVTDGHSCTIVDTVTITTPPIVSIALGSIPSVTPGTTSTILPYFSTSGSPATYTITWGLVAIGAGFSNVSAATLPATPITLAVPFTATAGTYSGILTVSNSTCTSVNYVINVVIGDTPPTFLDSSYYTIPVSICQNATSFNLVPYLHVSDIDSFQTETWSQLVAPNHGGTLVFTGATASSDTTDITPGGTITYTPSGSYSGIEVFTIQVSDGYATANIQVSISLNPTPVVTTPADEAICNGASSGALNFTSSVTGTTYTWSGTNATIGLATTGTGNIASFTAVNDSVYAVVDTIMVTPTASSCAGTTAWFILTVNPTPTVAAISNQLICNGANTAADIFTGTVTGTTYSWVNSNVAIGLTATGTGSIPSFTATNSTSGVEVATITVTPWAHGCAGTARSFTDSVKPSGMMTTPTGVAVCNGASSSAIIFTSIVSGTTYAWVNSDTTTGLDSNGTGNIASFTAIDTSSTMPVVTTVTVTPTSGGCPGTPAMFNITVNPIPVMVEPSNQSLCNGATTTAVTFSSSVTGATYFWTNSDPSVGLASLGTGNVASFTASNSSSSAAVAMIIITPTANGCSGTVDTFTITVNPSGEVLTLADQGVCNGSASTAVNFLSTVTGTTYTWSGSNSTIGLASSGSGNIASFTAINSGTVTVVDTITITPTAGGCVGATAFFVISANPTPAMTAPTGQALCNGSATAAITFSGASAGTTYSWTNDNFTIGLAPSGTGNIVSFTALNTTSSPEIANIVVTPIAHGCSGTSHSFAITVNPTPAVVTPSSIAVCNGAATGTLAFSSTVTGTTYVWASSNSTIGLASTGTGNIVSFTATNTATTPVIDTITVTPTASTCVGSSATFTITVNPTPVVTAPSNQVLCDGVASTAVTFSSTVTGTTYTWTNNNVAVGLVASGTGSVGSFIATNAITAAIVATVTVTPSAHGCAGTPVSFTITVNPTPVITTPANQTLCNGATSTSVIFSSTDTGTAYTWVSSNATIGLASTGTGNILAFTATNTATSPVLDTITVTPSVGGCTGADAQFTILVNPTPTVVAPLSQTVCNGAATAAVTFSGAVTGTTFPWINSNYTIGLVPSGTGTIASFTATNGGGSPDSAIITVTPWANGCSGTSHSFTIKVNPTPVITVPANQSICNGDTTTTVDFMGTVAGTTYTWSGSSATIGLASTGTGNIASFTTTNSGTSSVIDTIRIAANASSCAGIDTMFTITVKPTPTVTAPSNQVICNGVATAAVTFSGAVAGTSFTWANTNVSIGLVSADTGNIASFIATNLTIAPEIATITVTPAANGCTGSSQVFGITVNPTPTVATPANQAICNGSFSSVVNFVGTVTGTIYSWSNTNFSIGLATTGTGNIAVFTAIDTSLTHPVVDTISIIPTANGCAGNTEMFTITVNPIPVISPDSNQTVCNGIATVPVNFVSNVTGSTFTWNNSNTSIGLTSSAGTGNVPSFTGTNTTGLPEATDIAVFATANGCMSAIQVFTITVNPQVTFTTPSDQSICNGASTTAVNFFSTVTGITYTWTGSNATIGLATTGSGNIASFTATNTTSVQVIDTITVMPSANGCIGTAAWFAISVNPVPVTILPANQAICNGAATTADTFRCNVSGTTFAWTNSSVAVGLASSGTGTIASFTGTNTSSVPLVANITVIPTANGCSGVPSTVAITVNPIPSVTTPANQSVCAGASTLAVNFTGSVTGTAYTWMGSNATIGLASTGIGNIASFTALNATSSAQIDTITITPTAHSCTGPAQWFTITVNLIPAVVMPGSQALCNGTASLPVNFTGTVTGTTYSWTNSNFTIGLPLTGTGNIPSFVGLNSFTVPEIGTIVVTPSAFGCTGATQTFAITVNPTPTVATPSNQAVCNGASSLAVNFTGAVSGTTYTWVNNNTSIGLANTGSGNIGSFMVVDTDPAFFDSATIKVIAMANGCVGDSATFMIFGKPTPSVTASGNQSLCSGNIAAPISFSGLVGGTVFYWSNNNTSIGLFASDTGNIASFTAVDTSVNAVTAMIFVTPAANGCTGFRDSLFIFVKPNPVLSSSLTPPSVCDDSAFTYIPASLTTYHPVNYSWSRATVSGISNPFASGTGNITDTLIDTTANPVSVTYIITLHDSFCVNSQNVVLIVNPKPVLTSLLTPPAVCNGLPFSYVSLSATSGTTFTWSRAAVAGISNAANSGGSGYFSEILHDTTANPVTVTYVDTLKANGCINYQPITLIVNPTPKLSSSLTPTAICNNTVFSYPYHSLTSGTSFRWIRSLTLGISNDTASGINNPAEILTDTTNHPVFVTYQYDMNANGCLDTQNVTVMVNPTPKLSSSLTDSVCSGSLFSYTATSNTVGAGFAWSRGVVPGITNPAGSGTTSINDSLNNSRGYPISVTYAFTLSINGCNNIENLTLVVNNVPVSPTIDTKTGPSLCSNTQYQNFGTAYPAPSGQGYEWSVSNADLWNVGYGNQYCLISFPTPGASEITLTSIITGTNCTSSVTYTVDVSNNVSNLPQLIFYDNYFICQESDADSYVWGYDDALTLDSTLIVGQTSQDLYFSSTPDFSRKYYWVITTKNGCSQKSYYIVPPAAVQTVQPVTSNSLSLYPNPAEDVLNIKLIGKRQDNAEIRIFDMLGRQMMTLPLYDNGERISIVSLIPGTYVVGCYVNGMKLASGNFIKE